MQVKKLSSEQEHNFAAKISKDLVTILGDSKDRVGTIRRDIPMILSEAYDRTGGDGRVVALALTMAYRQTGDQIFEELKRDSVKSVFLKE